MTKFYEIKNNVIIIHNKREFNIVHICECGQMFRFEKTNKGYILFSQDMKTEIIEYDDRYEIISNNPIYFVDYFDLDTDYLKIQNSLKGEIMSVAIEYGCGIRILKQNLYEMLISFIISANNNIKRIKNIIESLCKKYGSDMGEYFAFPTIAQLKNVTSEDYKNLGAGYRAKYLAETIKALQNYDLDKLEIISTEDARKELIKFMGVGRKVADCILLFGLHKLDVFPVDTWIEKVYRDYYFDGVKNREQISRHLVDYYGNLSGYAQQYLFYYKREL